MESPCGCLCSGNRKRGTDRNRPNRYPGNTAGGRNPAPPKKLWIRMIPLYIPTNTGVPWFQSGAKWILSISSTPVAHVFLGEISMSPRPIRIRRPRFCAGTGCAFGDSRVVFPNPERSQKVAAPNMLLYVFPGDSFKIGLLRETKRKKPFCRGVIAKPHGKKSARRNSRLLQGCELSSLTIHLLLPQWRRK